MSNPIHPNPPPQTDKILARVRTDNENTINETHPQWEAAREAVLAQISTPNNSNFPSTLAIAPSLTPGPKTGGRRGRGARRGSPIARGTITVRPAVDPNALHTPPSGGRARARGKNRGGRPRGTRTVRGSTRGGKRKRTSDDEHDDTDASETFAPLPTQSRSGRKIFQAATAPVSTIKIDDDHNDDEIRNQNAMPPPPLLFRTPLHPAASTTTTTNNAPLSSEQKRKARYRRPPGAAAVCKNCQRGHSPASNVIVFCDGCNKPWHQYCHDPPIRGEMAQIQEKEWFCADCTVLREESGRLKGRVSGEGMTLVEKRAYLLTLPPSHLVSLLLHATHLHPSLPIFFPPNALSHHSNPPSLPPKTLSNPPPATSTHQPPLPLVLPPSIPTNQQPQPPIPPPPPIPVDETYYEEEEHLPYPKAGNGIQLPPEEEDMAFLLDGDAAVFSHWVGRPMQQGLGMVGMTGVGAVRG
ncbi:hypothetical protein MMC14_006704 [Varicellaria rhodocarpa]|nr:hypothetical protein [Varicellaria rhodocarpa]